MKCYMHELSCPFKKVIVSWITIKNTLKFQFLAIFCHQLSPYLQNSLIFISVEISNIKKKILWGALTAEPPPSVMDENKSTKTWSAWGGEVANLSKQKGQEPFPQWAFIGFNLHRNTGKAHQSLSGSKDQTIDNKRTLGAYSESGSVS